VGGLLEGGAYIKGGRLLEGALIREWRLVQNGCKAGEVLNRGEAII